jgi:hypothetical protein
MSIPAHWPPHVRDRARRFLALWKYYRFSRTLSEAAVPFFKAHCAGVRHERDDTLRGIAYLSYWIASLEVLCEGWEELKLFGSAVDPLVTQDHRATLRRYRHTVFHFQADLDEKRIAALTTSSDVMEWVLALGEAYQDFFEHHADAIDVERIRPWLFAPAV